MDAAAVNSAVTLLRAAPARWLLKGGQFLYPVVLRFGLC